MPTVVRSRGAVEWPTIALAAVIYGGWGAVTLAHAALPPWLLMPLGAWFTAWHASLQHEIIHGHPTRNRAVNRWLGTWPLLLWLPFQSYRITHLVHHRDERLTDPLDDPESNYWTPEQWGRLGWARRIVIAVNATFLGRILVGPSWVMGRYVAGEMVAILRGDRLARRIWAGHALQAALVLAWVVGVCGMHPLTYVLAFVYPGTALMLVRSFAEHKAESAVEERTAIVENAPVLGLLYLYNNLHVVHHDNPMMPWYAIPAWYRANRERLVRENGGLVYDGYLDIARRFFLTAHDAPVHPLGRVPQQAV